MSRAEIYKVFLQLDISHGYYPQGVPLRVVPCRKTAMRMDRSGALFKKTGRGRWVLLGLEPGPASGPVIETGESVSFDLIPCDDLFWYVTGPVYGGVKGAKAGDINGKAREVDLSATLAVYDDGSTPGTSLLLKTVTPPVPGVWRRLEIPLHTYEKRPVEVELDLKCPSRFLEYILVPRYNPAGLVPVLREERGRIGFGPAEKTRFMGGDAYRIVSTGAVEPASEHPYKIILYEPRPAGERVLYPGLPLPRYDQPSPAGPHDTVTNYFYY